MAATAAQLAALRRDESPAEASARSDDDAGGASAASDDEDDPRRFRPSGRPSTAPSADADPVQTWGRAGHLTEAQAVHLAAMRRNLPAADEDECLRWLRGRGFHVAKAMELKASHDAWWRDQRATFHAPAAEIAEQLLRRRLLCWTPRRDLRGRPVLTINVGAFDPACRDAALASLLTSLDACIAASPCAELTVVFDLRTYGTANADVKTAIALIKALQTGYPERLGLAVFLGAPRVFSFMWRAVRVLLDARIVSKVHFVQKTAEMDALVGLWALPPSLGGTDERCAAHMQRWCEQLAAAEAAGGAKAVPARAASVSPAQRASSRA